MAGVLRRLIGTNRRHGFGKIVQMVGVAQLVEPRVVIPVVVGSNPIAHPIFRIDGSLPFPGGQERRQVAEGL